MNRKTFIHHDGALGDLLLSLSAISLLREGSGFVHLAGSGDAVSLLHAAGLVDEVSSSSGARYASLYSPVVAHELREFLARFDDAVVFAAGGESDAATGIRSVVEDTRIIRTIPPAGLRIHVADYRLGQLCDHGGVPALPRLTLPQKRVEQARRFLADCGFDFSRPLFSVHPGSGGARKCWPVGNYLQLLSMLRGWCDPFVILFSGPAESGALKAELDAFSAKHQGTLHVSVADLASVAALISLSDLYLGNDSGISHLASIVNTGSLVFFGPTDPILWKPQGGGVRMVQSAVGCSPCGDERSRGCRERKCLTSVSADDVYAMVRQWYGEALQKRFLSHVDHDLQGDLPVGR